MNSKRGITLPAGKYDFGAEPGCVAGHQLTLRQHEGLVDLDDHLIIVLLDRAPPEPTNPISTYGASIPSAAYPRVSESEHELDVGVSQPNQELLRRRHSPQEPQFRGDPDPPRSLLSDRTEASLPPPGTRLV